MNTKTQPTHKKLPAARVGYALPESYDQSGKVIHGWPKHHKGYIPLAVIPCHTAAQAKQIVKAAEFLRLPEEEKVERLAEALRAAIEPQFAAKVSWARCVDKNHYRLMAPVFLAAMGMGGASK